VTWVRLIAGVVLMLLGLVWVGQGINLLHGSVMSGQWVWAIIGTVLVVVGAWLLWSTLIGRRATTRT
jgi:hypothetical protein